MKTNNSFNNSNKNNIDIISINKNKSDDIHAEYEQKHLDNSHNTINNNFKKNTKDINNFFHKLQSNKKQLFKNCPVFKVCMGGLKARGGGKHKIPA